jgi:hypothetical protein
MFVPMNFKSVILILFSIWFLLPKSSVAFDVFDSFKKSTSVSPLKNNSVNAVMDIADLDVEDDDVDDILKKSTLFQIVFFQLVYHVQIENTSHRFNPHSSIASIFKIKFTLPESLCIFRI